MIGRLLRAVLAAALLCTLFELGAGTSYAQDETTAVTCPTGFVLDDDQQSCSKTTPAETASPTCPVGASGEPGACYTTQAQTDTGESTCDEDPAGPEGCAIRIVDATGGGPGCPLGFSAKPGEPDRCLRTELANPADPVCPRGTLTIGEACFAVPAPISEEPLTCPPPSEPSDGQCLQPAAPTSATGTFFCSNPAGVLEGRNCIFETSTRSIECPTGFGLDESLGSLCARFEAASTTAPSCPLGARGEPDNCYILVARGPRGAATCDNILDTTTPDPDDRITGVLIGTNCVIAGDPPTAGPDTCPVSETVMQEGADCFTLTPRVDGVCPADTSPDPGGVECRQPEPLRPGALACTATFELNAGECVRFLPPFFPAAQCPADTVEDGDGCRRTIENVAPAYFCEDADAALNGRSCVFIANALPQSCPTGDILDGGFCITYRPPRAVFACADGTTQDTDGLCRTAVADVPGTPFCTDATAELVDEVCVRRAEPLQPQPTPTPEPTSTPAPTATPAPTPQTNTANALAYPGPFSPARVDAVQPSLDTSVESAPVTTTGRTTETTVTTTSLAVTGSEAAVLSTLGISLLASGGFATVLRRRCVHA